MKKVLWAILVVAIVGFIVWSKNPIDDAMNFIIGGSVPGTQLSLGFWPMMGIIGVILLFIRRGIRNARLQMLEDTAKNIRREKVHAEFKEQNSGEFDHSKRSVIAARKTELTV